MAKLALIAYDKAPSDSLAAMGRLARGHEVAGLLLGGDQAVGASPEEHAAIIRDADILVVGMSSPAKNAAIELQSLELAKVERKKRKKKKPLRVVLHADIPEAGAREWFAPHRKIVDLLLVPNEQARVEMSPLYQSSDIAVVGNPNYWKYCRAVDRQAIRKELGVARGEVLVFRPFTKDAVLNIGTVNMVIDAVAAQETERFRILLGVHPRDPSKNAYASYTDLSVDVIGEGRVRFTDKSADDVLPAADVVIGPAASGSFHAMARGIPILDAHYPLAQAWIRRDTGGSRSTFAARCRVAIEFESTPELATYLSAIAHPSADFAAGHMATINAARQRGRDLMPFSLEGEAERRMLEAVLSLL